MEIVMVTSPLALPIIIWTKGNYPIGQWAIIPRGTTICAGFKLLPLAGEGGFASAKTEGVPRDVFVEFYVGLDPLLNPSALLLLARPTFRSNGQTISLPGQPCFSKVLCNNDFEIFDFVFAYSPWEF